MANGVKSVKLVIDEVGPMPDSPMAYERSHYTMYTADGTVADSGK